jgi:hypothetical protein
LELEVQQYREQLEKQEDHQQTLAQLYELGLIDADGQPTMKEPEGDEK